MSIEINNDSITIPVKNDLGINISFSLNDNRNSFEANVGLDFSAFEPNEKYDLSKSELAQLIAALQAMHDKMGE